MSGASTEVNSECYAALLTASHMARVLDKHDESAEFCRAAEALKTAINTHLKNPGNGLYYLNIDVDGYPAQQCHVRSRLPRHVRRRR